MKKKIIVSILVLIILGAVGVWYFVFYAPTHVDRTKNTNFTISSQALVKEFVTNEDSANKKYISKVVQVSGQVKNIQSDSTGTTVFLETGDSVNTISFRLLKNNATITKGSTVTVKGILTGYILNEVQLNEAVITSSTPAPTATQTPTTATVPKDSPIQKKTIDTIKKEVAAAPKIYKSKTASIKFFSHTPAEDIEATNTQIVSSLNAATGQLSFAALIKGFRFENELMQDHFNSEKYLNSNQFPKAEFKGNITNLSSIQFNTNGTYKASVDGTLTIHGVTKSIKANGSITVSGTTVKVNSVFNVHVQDYQIDGSEVAENIDVTVNASYN